MSKYFSIWKLTLSLVIFFFGIMCLFSQTLVNGQSKYSQNGWELHSIPECGISIKTPKNFSLNKPSLETRINYEFEIESEKPYMKITLECGNLGSKFSGNIDRDLGLVKNQSIKYDQYLLQDTILNDRIVENFTVGTFVFASGEDAHTGIVTNNEFFIFYFKYMYILIKISVLDNDNSFNKYELKDSILKTMKILN